MPLSLAQHAVEQLCADRTPFSEVEDFIDGLPLDDERKSALWLLAWSSQPPESQHLLATESLAALALV